MPPTLLEMKREILMGSAEGTRLLEKHPEMKKKVFGFYSKAFEGQGRRINRFMLGADPEFIFSQDDMPVHATRLGLRPGLAFGSDQNDRLVELRPAPSRSALEVVASVLAELRWMHRLCPNTRTPNWLAGAFVHDDGLGGHVHFGRKRPALRSTEVRGLDGIAKMMKATQVMFPNAEWDRRTRGDAHGQRYGLYGDIREQKHGYEYRTLPSWMDTPKLAFLVLTLSKLVIVDPEIAAGWEENVQPQQAFERLRGLANLYRGRDDDAWLLASMMGRLGNFAWQGGDFKTRWGLTPTRERETVKVYPQIIEPTAQDVGDLQRHLMTGVALDMRRTEPNFVADVPRDYMWLLPHILPNRRPGVGDLIPDIVVSNQVETVFDFPGDDRFHIAVPADFNITKVREAMREMHGAQLEQYAGQNRFLFMVGRHWRTGHGLAQARQLILSGLFPVWTVGTVKPDSYAEWQRSQIAVVPRAADRFNVAELFEMPQAA